MKQSDKVAVLAFIAALLLIGGFCCAHLNVDASLGADPDDDHYESQPEGTFVANLGDNVLDDGHMNPWNCQPWQIRHAGGSILRLNHPLHSRPPYPGYFRTKVIQEGWDGWFCNPPDSAVI